MKPMTDTQRRLFQLDLRKAEIEKYYEDLEQAIKDVEAENGINSYFQGSDGVVYKIVKPTGTFVSYKDLNYVRTKRADEARGSLSAKEATAQGFTVIAG